MKNFKNLLAALMLAGTLVGGLHASSVAPSTLLRAMEDRAADGSGEASGSSGDADDLMDQIAETLTELNNSSSFADGPFKLRRQALYERVFLLIPHSMRSLFGTLIQQLEAVQDDDWIAFQELMQQAETILFSPGVDAISVNSQELFCTYFMNVATVAAKRPGFLTTEFTQVKDIFERLYQLSDSTEYLEENPQWLTLETTAELAEDSLWQLAQQGNLDVFLNTARWFIQKANAIHRTPRLREIEALASYMKKYPARVRDVPAITRVPSRLLCCAFKTVCSSERERREACPTLFHISCSWTAHTELAVIMRALVLGGRATLATRGARSTRSSASPEAIQWTCLRAPLWAVMQIVTLLQDR